MEADELQRVSTALRRQWQRLRDWVGVVVDADRAALTDRPVLAEASVLDGWTVGELLAHLGRAMDALAACEPAPDGTVPLTLAEYLGGYRERADEIAQVTRALAAEIAHDPLGEVDTRAAAAFARLDELGPQDRVVQARRGPVLLSAMTTSRVLELVVHGDDLQRSLARARGAAPGSAAELGRGDARTRASAALAGLPGPVDPEALELVAGALLDIVVARGGWDLRVAQPLTWVRLAAGRVPYDVDVLAEALQPGHPSDAVPDLGRQLPLL